MSAIDQSFWHNLSEQRKNLLKIALTLFAGFLLSFIFYNPISKCLNFLESGSAVQNTSLIIEKLTNTSSQKIFYRLPSGATILEPEAKELIQRDTKTFEIATGSSLVIQMPLQKQQIKLIGIQNILKALKMSFWVGFIISSPLLIYFISKLLVPELYRENKRPSSAIVLLYISAICGSLFAYYITIPFENRHLVQKVGLNLSITRSVLLLFFHGLIFEFILILFVLIYQHILSVQTLIKMRTYVIMSFILLCGLISYPDVLAQIMMAIALIGIYEISLLYAKSRCKFTVAESTIN